MVKSGLDILIQKIPKELRGKRAGILCHAASVSSSYIHILDAMTRQPLHVGAIFGPQHGLFGQTQDNMIEWEGGYIHPVYKTPVYSLYGKSRKPSADMLQGLDVFCVDLQDIGARPYTYIWTVKLCMEACMELGIPVWILDRPNPIAAVPFDGPLLNEEYFSFVGGACIPLCHRMTIGEMAVLLKQKYFPKLELNLIRMKGWWRDSLFHETGLPWVIPSSNMPSVQTAVVYPGMVLLEGTNLSEGRGTTIPFALFGAPSINTEDFMKNISRRKLPGCIFREHAFIPMFQKWQGSLCNGFQIHVTDPRSYLPVFTAASILEAVIQTSKKETFSFKQPPYEYEYVKMPFDILSGDTRLRECLMHGGSLKKQQNRWRSASDSFRAVFADIACYPEKRK